MPRRAIAIFLDRWSAGSPRPVPCAPYPRRLTSGTGYERLTCPRPHACACRKGPAEAPVPAPVPTQRIRPTPICRKPRPAIHVGSSGADPTFRIPLASCWCTAEVSPFGPVFPSPRVGAPLDSLRLLWRCPSSTGRTRLGSYDVSLSRCRNFLQL